MPSVAEPLLATLAARARRLRVGDPGAAEAEIGPLASHDDLATIEELVGEAVADGAELVSGGPTSVPGLSGAFYAPAILRRVPHDRPDPPRARAGTGARDRRGRLGGRRDRARRGGAARRPATAGRGRAATRVTRARSPRGTGARGARW